MTREVIGGLRTPDPQLPLRIRRATRAAGADRLVRHVGAAGRHDRRGTAKILGSLTLVVFAIPTAVRAWIEDVVVDESSAAGGESGEALNRAALEPGRGSGRGDGRSHLPRPLTGAGNRLYRRLGSSRGTPTSYRYDL